MTNIRTLLTPAPMKELRVKVSGLLLLNHLVIYVQVRMGCVIQLGETLLLLSISCSSCFMQAQNGD